MSDQDGSANIFVRILSETNVEIKCNDEGLKQKDKIKCCQKQKIVLLQKVSQYVWFGSRYFADEEVWFEFNAHILQMCKYLQDSSLQSALFCL